MIFTSAMSFKVLDQLENWTPVWKWVETELPSVTSLNNLDGFSFIIYLYTKDLLHHPKHDLSVFGKMYQNANYLPVI